MAAARRPHARRSRPGLRWPAGCGIALWLALAAPATAAPEATVVRSEAELRTAWADPQRRRIDLGADITLRDCRGLEPIRESPFPILLDGHGHTLRQTCFERRLLRQDGTGFVDLRRVRLTRGGADGPGAAVTTRGELSVRGSVVTKSLAEEPGGGLFSMRRVVVRRSRITGNLANDDGGGIYARRGGVQVYDSILSNNLVDGSGGAIGSTGDILVVRSEIDGNTTDGDGGALYADEDGDVTVVDSLIDGSNADGPGGAIFTLDGDVAVLGSTLIGNRADDRGGAISGEADVLLVNSTVARNLAVAHAGGGVWARGDLMIVNGTVTDNYAEGEGGGILAAGTTTLLHSTVSANISSVAANVGSAGPLRAFASIIGPAQIDATTGDARPTRRSCRVYRARSLGFNFLTDATCELTGASDVRGTDPQLRRLEDDPTGFVLTPFDNSPVRARVPGTACTATRLPQPLPAERLLRGFADWEAILAHDAVGAPRGGTVPCDIGAVQSPLPPAEPAPAPSPPPVAGAARRPAGPTAGTIGRPPSSAAGVARRPPAFAAGDPTGSAGPASPRAAGRASASAATLAAELRQLDRASRRGDALRRCVREVPADRTGDPAHRWGFAYDERDGTGQDRRPALTRHRGPGRADLRFLRLTRSSPCLSAPPDPTGTARAAAAPAHGPAATGAAAAAAPTGPAALQRTVRRVRARVDRFDAWESCLSSLPVTEAGHPEQDLGYLRPRTATGPGHAAAIDLDDTDAEDPDYELLALVGADRPGAADGCVTEPGEGFDGLDPLQTAVAADGDGALESLREDVEDLRDPVGDITRFDECLYTVGARERGGYAYRDRRGRLSRRRTLAFDLHGPHLPQLDLLAFPGEEPPQIECNEDAGGDDDDD